MFRVLAASPGSIGEGLKCIGERREAINPCPAYRLLGFVGMAILATCLDLHVALMVWKDEIEIFEIKKKSLASSNKTIFVLCLNQEKLFLLLILPLTLDRPQLSANSPWSMRFKRIHLLAMTHITGE